jgi:hypothetical protein
MTPNDSGEASHAQRPGRQVPGAPRRQTDPQELRDELHRPTSADPNNSDDLRPAQDNDGTAE